MLVKEVGQKKEKEQRLRKEEQWRRRKMAKNVRAIPATVNLFDATPITNSKKRRVAAYARVSTDQEEQLTSYEAQVDYYTNYIKSRSDWEFVDVYTDEGISGTSTKHREGFNKMVEYAMAGNIDLIITKSVSRFARNTVDSLTTIRKLKVIGCECYFEKENIWTFDGKGELLLTIMSSLAQGESRSISENVKWGHRKRDWCLKAERCGGCSPAECSTSSWRTGYALTARPASLRVRLSAATTNPAR